MMKRNLSLIIVLALWLGLVAFAWLKPAEVSSDSERRQLAQMPKATAQTLLSGEFMSDFADYAVDQFPLRDLFRRINAHLTYDLLGQTDNNGIYIHDGCAAKMEYPLNETALNYAADRFQDLYETYLQDTSCRILFAVVPDKGYYLAESAGVLSMDYEKLFSRLEERLTWAEFVDITEGLSIESYYRTDTHWRIEALFGTANTLSAALGMESPEESECTVETARQDFYGVYYGQAAIPMEAEPLNYVTWPGWEECRVYSLDTGLETPLYDMEKLDSKDPYEIFLSGGMAVQVVTNPNAPADRELILFRDSFGSALAPLLAMEYGRITLIDTRYVAPAMLAELVEFKDQDVLFLYSTLLLNDSASLRK